MRNSLITIALVLTLAAGPLRGQEAALWVDAATASQATVHPVIRVAGTLEPVWQAALAGTQGGRLRELRFDVGDSVASGAVAWVLDDTDARLALESAQAAEQVAVRQLEELRSGVRQEEIERLQAIVGEAQFFLSQIQAEKSRLGKLFDQELVPAAKWDEVGFREKMAGRAVAAAEAALKGARAGPTARQVSVLQAQVDQARALVAQSRKRLEDCTILAPRPCRVVARLKHPGEILSPGEAVLRLIALDPIKIRFHIGENQATDLEGNRPLLVQIPAGAPPRPATLTAVIPQCDPTTRRIPCEALLDNPDGRLFPGQSAEVSLELPAVSGTTIPRSAILEQGGQTTVFLIEGGRVRSVPVRVISHLDGTSIVDGLAPGNQVVSRGGFGLQDGAAVNLRP